MNIEYLSEYFFDVDDKQKKQVFANAEIKAQEQNLFWCKFILENEKKSKVIEIETKRNNAIFYFQDEIFLKMNSLEVFDKKLEFQVELSLQLHFYKSLLLIRRLNKGTNCDALQYQFESLWKRFQVLQRNTTYFEIKSYINELNAFGAQLQTNEKAIAGYEYTKQELYSLIEHNGYTDAYSDSYMKQLEVRFYKLKEKYPLPSWEKAYAFMNLYGQVDLLREFEIKSGRADNILLEIAQLSMQNKTTVEYCFDKISHIESSKLSGNAFQCFIDYQPDFALELLSTEEYQKRVPFLREHAKKLQFIHKSISSYIENNEEFLLTQKDVNDWSTIFDRMQEGKYTESENANYIYERLNQVRQTLINQTNLFFNCPNYPINLEIMYDIVKLERVYSATIKDEKCKNQIERQIQCLKTYSDTLSAYISLCIFLKNKHFMMSLDNRIDILEDYKTLYIQKQKKEVSAVYPLLMDKISYLLDVIQSKINQTVLRKIEMDCNLEFENHEKGMQLIKLM